MVRLDLATTNAVGETAVSVRSGLVSFSDESRLMKGVPQLIPKDEVLFWTPEWQEIINEGRAALTSGESVEFANFKELALWLLSPNDDD